MTIAKKIRSILTDRGWTMRQFCDELQRGGFSVTRVTIWAWLAGSRQPRDPAIVHRALDALPAQLSVAEDWQKIEMRVGRRMLQHSVDNPGLKMIAVRGLAGSLDNPVHVALFSNRELDLVLKDVGFWRTHQKGPAVALFDQLFSLLSLRPGKSITFAVNCLVFKKDYPNE